MGACATPGQVITRRFFPWTEPKLRALGPNDKLLPHSPCPFPWQHLVIQWDGKVVTCCRDHNGSNVMGDVREQSLVDIWNGATYDRLRAQAAAGAWPDFPLCERCEPMYRSD